MTQTERLLAYLKSLDTRHPHIVMVKFGQDGEPEWWANQGVVMGADNLVLCSRCGTHGPRSADEPEICAACAAQAPMDMQTGVIGPIRRTNTITVGGDEPT